MLDYRDYIYAVYKYRNFSKAAKELHVSQPWLSSAIKKTEQELKLKLFDRSTTPISLTDAGEYYIGQIEKIYAIEKEMDLRFAKMRAGSGGRIRIGSSMFFCTYVFPSLLEDFCAQFPQITLSFTEGNTQMLSEKLLKGELDLVFEVEKTENKQITTVPVSEEEVVLAVPAEYAVNRELEEYRYTFEEFLRRGEPGRKKPCVPLERFSDEPFIILNEDNDLHGRSIALCRNAGFSPKVKLVLAQLMTSYYLVCEGQGVAFLRSSIPEHVAPTDHIVFYQLSDPLATRSIYLSYIERDMPDMQRELIRYIHESQL